MTAQANTPAPAAATVQVVPTDPRAEALDFIVKGLVTLGYKPEEVARSFAKFGAGPSAATTPAKKEDKGGTAAPATLAHKDDKAAHGHAGHKPDHVADPVAAVKIGTPVLTKIAADSPGMSFGKAAAKALADAKDKDAAVAAPILLTALKAINASFPKNDVGMEAGKAASEMLAKL